MDNEELQNIITEKPISDKSRHFLAVFFFSFMWGTFGVDRFYLGKYWTGLLKLLTLGGFGLWTLVDLTMVMSGDIRDKQGNEMIDAKKYKKLAKRTVSIFSFVAILFIVSSTILAYYLIYNFIQSGGMQNVITDLINKNVNIDQIRSMYINL